MPSFIKNLTFDCEDALRVARFWAAALVSDVDEESTSERAYVEAPGWGGPNIWFRGGRGPKSAPNRVHVDLRALTSMGEEVERLIALGARVDHARVGLGAGGLAPSVACFGENGRGGPTREAM